MQHNKNVTTEPNNNDIIIDTKNFAIAKPNIYPALSVSIKLVKPLQTSKSVRLIASLTVDSPIVNNNKFELICNDCIILTTATGSTAEIILAYEKQSSIDIPALNKLFEAHKRPPIIAAANSVPIIL